MSTPNPKESLTGAPVVAPEAATPKGKENKGRKFKKNKWQQKRAHNTKVRVKLPSIESYQKELEFHADAPGRVIVRLERLMGTDKIRITDAKYMSTLLERLEQEENEAWLRRTRERKQAERNRFRQLAVEGLMEPTADMEDLYNHPVFRVNRILNRLAKLDTDISLTPTRKLPPITPVEPFADGSGGRRYFLANSPAGDEEAEDFFDEESDEEEETRMPGIAFDDEGDEDDEEEENVTEEAEEEAMKLPEPSTTTADDMKISDEWGGEDYAGSNITGESSLAAAKRRYGIPPSENIEFKCKAFRSKLVDLVFDDEAGGASEMYDVAKEVLGAYKRETMTADDFVIKLNKLL